MKSRWYSIAILVLAFASFAANAQNVMFEIAWRHNPNAQIYCLDVSENLDYVVFASHELRQPDSPNREITLLTKSGQVMRKSRLNRNDWGALSKTLVTNSGNIIALATTLSMKLGDRWGSQSQILSISTGGDLLWSKRLDDILVDDISITSDGNLIGFTHGNVISLLDENGSKIWTHSYGTEDEYSFAKIEISNDGTLIVVYETHNQKIQAFDRGGEGQWSIECPEFNGFRMNKRTRTTGILSRDRKDIVGFLTTKLFDSQGGSVAAIGYAAKNWHDFAISDKNEACITQKDDLGHYGLVYFSPSSNSRDKPSWVHEFEPPSGFQHSYPDVRIGDNGETIILSDGFEVVSFKKKQLEKKW